MKLIKNNILVSALYVILAIGLAVGTFYDYQISSTLTKMDDTWAYFMEKWAEPPSLLFVGFAFVALAVCIARQKEIKQRYYLGALCFVGGCISNCSTVVRTFEYYNVTSPFALFVVIGIAITALFVPLTAKIDQQTLLKAKRALVCVAVMALATLVIISALKSVWGRLRFREMQEASQFTKWFIPMGKAADDAHKSFPSGHTSNAVLVCGIPFILKAIGKNKAYKTAVGASVLWVAFVMFSRMVCGAHFLSDTCAGAMITMTIALVCHRIFCKE